MDKYPDLGSNPLKPHDLKRILHDFPDFNDERSVREKSDVVLQYYNGLMKTEIKPAIQQALKTKGGRKGARIRSPFNFGQINSLEWEHLLTNISMIPGYSYASNEAVRQTSARFGTTADGERANAFQHAVWNCLIVREAFYYRGFSKNNAILFTRNITSDHECDDNGNRQYGNNEAMDLHNNLSARSWYSNNMSGGVWPFSVQCPSEGDIFSAWEHAANNRNFHICNPATTITSIFDWGFLYGTPTANMGDRLYFYLPVLQGC